MLAYVFALLFLVLHAQEPRAADAHTGSRTAFNAQQFSGKSWIPAASWLPNDARPLTEAITKPLLQQNAIDDLGQTSRLIEPTQDGTASSFVKQLSQPFQPAGGVFGFGAPVEPKGDAVTPTRLSSGDVGSGHTHSSEVRMHSGRQSSRDL